MQSPTTITHPRQPQQRVSPVPVQSPVIVSVKKVRLCSECAHVRMDPDKLQHGPRAPLLHPDDQRVGQLLVPVPLGHGEVVQSVLGGGNAPRHVATTRGGGGGGGVFTSVAGVTRSRRPSLIPPPGEPDVRSA